jgi:hypothetical protein
MHIGGMNGCGDHAMNASDLPPPMDFFERNEMRGASLIV